MIDQVIIFGTGVCATWLSQDMRPSHQRWACIFGLIGQPAWFYAAWQAEQWGVFALAFVFTAAWSRGLWNFWLRRRFA
jgi:nicotinamide riboside transporter PnuC